MSDRALAPDARAAARDAAREEHKAAVEAQQVEAPEFMDAGYEETLPGQVEVVAGTVAHTQVLNSFANATSYGPDVNVVVPAPEEPPPPPEGSGDPMMREQEEQERLRQQQEMEGGR